jgi:galactose-1-phosphate uridylyltransferase
MIRGASVLFPNLFPYGAHSAVSLFDDRHFVEIGTASPESYANCFLNCAEYLRRVRTQDPEAVYMAITQNHLPSAGGSLLHPHLQLQADRIASNHQRFLKERASEHFRQTGRLLLSDYLQREKVVNQRYIGATGAWEWLAAYAPEGFFEIYGILPQATSLSQVTAAAWEGLAQGVLNTQRYYRSLTRNGYNLGMLAIEDGASKLELRVIILARSNYAPWVRSDHTGFEVMLGDMATFTAPEDTATAARPFWNQTESIRA